MEYAFFEGRSKDERFLKNVNAVRTELQFDNILSYVEQLKIVKINRTKIRFFYWGGVYQWASIESVAMAFFKDPSFDVMVVSVNDNYEPKKRTVEKTGIAIVDCRDYHIGTDLPDIVVLNNQIDFAKYNNLRNVKMIVNIPSVLVNGWIVKDHIQDMMTENILGNGAVMPDCYLVEKIIYDAFAPEDLKNKTWFVCGNPKFDLIYNNVMNDYPVTDAWKKLKGKKIILWAFDHNWQTTGFSFDLYFKFFISWFAQHEDVALIIRPHQVFIYEMYNKAIWPRDGEKKIKEMLGKTENVIWDDSPNYGQAYAICDAVITDINCGITISALPLKKPIAVLQRYDGNECEPHYPEVTDSLYHIKSYEELIEFLYMVKAGKDPMLGKRMGLIKKYIANFDGQNGQRIKNKIVELYQRKLKNYREQVDCSCTKDEEKDG